MSYVYVFSNKSMPGLLKIGYSKDVCARAKELYSHSGVPSKFTIEYSGECSDPASVERAAHRYFRKARLNARREYFEVRPEAAIAFIESQPQFVKRAYCKKDWIENVKVRKRERAEEQLQSERRRQEERKTASELRQKREELVEEANRRNAALQRKGYRIRYYMTENNTLELDHAGKNNQASLSFEGVAKVAGAVLAATLFGV